MHKTYMFRQTKYIVQLTGGELCVARKMYNTKYFSYLCEHNSTTHTLLSFLTFFYSLKSKMSLFGRIFLILHI